jgi:hypothetical protein
MDTLQDILTDFAIIPNNQLAYPAHLRWIARRLIAFAKKLLQEADNIDNN